MGWLTSFTTWLAEQFNSRWRAFQDWVLEWWDTFQEWTLDMGVLALETCLDLAAMVVERVPVPDFIESNSIAGFLGQAGPEIAWIVGTFQIDVGLGMIGAAYAFRMLRKVLTLFQW